MSTFEINGLRNLVRSDLLERIRRAEASGEPERAEEARRELRELDEMP